MQTFNEWANVRIKMSFMEKYNMLLNRLSALNAMKTSADMVLNAPKGVTAISTCGYGCGYGFNENKSIEDLVKDVELMWQELKKEVIESVKAKEKAMQKQKQKDKNA